MKKNILIIIINWREPKMTVECVEATQKMTGIDGCDILVIDNGSGDDSAVILQESLNGVFIWEMESNLGFGRGNNEGLRWALGKGYQYALLLNNDAFPQPTMLNHLLEHTAPDVALVSPKIYYDTDRNRIWFAGASAKKRTLNALETGIGEIDVGQFSENRFCDYLFGTCLLVNLEAVKKVGLFDDRYFMYYEDMDWSIRFRQANYRLLMAAQAHLYHRVAVSSGGEESPARFYAVAKSGVIFWRDYASSGSPGLVLIHRLAHIAKTSLILLMKANIACFRSYWRGLRDGFRAS